ncbi:carboxypeptidase-like regulatory domain-containing protein [Aureibaculum conchae]|uniref:carboxypeptidase-like regulatory domain-containing protein n=1 Tax=Aureibaculum sp. 2308TA14-22 TaxID=3108392 RepID=UPI003397D6F8
MLDYIIKVLLFQTLFLAFYDLLLKRETFFQWNRVYLLATSVLAYVIPSIKINQVQEMIPQEYLVLLPEVVLNPSAVIEQQFDWSMLFFLVLKVIFWFGVLVAKTFFVLRLYKIIKLITTNDKEFTSSYYLVWLKNNKAFSFFNYIFLGKERSNKSQIIEHELVHVKQKHSLDLLFFELQKIVFWFNPYSYLYQARVAELHEFIADSKAIKAESKAIYFNNLLAETFSTQNISFINPFFKKSLLKKRIVMLNKNKSKQLLKFKYALLIPALLGMLAYTSCEKAEPIIEKETPLEEITIESPETKKFIDERLNKIIEELKKADNGNDDRKQMTKEALYLYLLKKKEEVNSHISGKEEVESRPIDEIVIKNGVPFAAIENAPIFPDCENAEDPKKCFQESIQKYVGQKFNMGLTKTLQLEPGENKVYVQFKIGKDGSVTAVRARAPHADLVKEAIRVIKSLPKMIPGEYEGKKVAVKYTLPITLMVTNSEDQKHGVNYQKSKLESQPKVLASINNTLKQGVIYGNVNGNVSGKLKGLPGVAISVKGKSAAVVTDFDGNFKIKANKGETLVFNFKGLPQTEFKINENNNYKITM